jgi:hypothetical protein
MGRKSTLNKSKANLDMTMAVEEEFGLMGEHDCDD